MEMQDRSGLRPRTADAADAARAARGSRRAALCGGTGPHRRRRRRARRRRPRHRIPLLPDAGGTAPRDVLPRRQRPAPLAPDARRRDRRPPRPPRRGRASRRRVDPRGREARLRAVFRTSLDPAQNVARPARRRGYIAQLLAPIRDDLEPGTYDGLAAGLTLLFGIDPIVSLRDNGDLATEQIPDALRLDRLPARRLGPRGSRHLRGRREKAR